MRPSAKLEAARVRDFANGPKEANGWARGRGGVFSGPSLRDPRPDHPAAPEKFNETSTKWLTWGNVLLNQGMFSGPV